MKTTQHAIRVCSTVGLDLQDLPLQTPTSQLQPQASNSAQAQSTQQPYRPLASWNSIADDSTWFAAIAHSSPDLIGAVSLSGNWLWINPAGRSQLNWSLQLPTLAATLSQETQRQWQDIGLPTVLQHGYWCGQMAMRAASNQFFLVESQWFLVRDRDTNQPICIATISRRLTDLADETAVAQTDQRSCFLAEAAHELRNPLAVIASSTDILQSQYDCLDNARRGKHFQRIHTKIRQITQILEDLLTLSQSERTHLDVQPSAIDVLELCTSIIEEARTSTSNHEIIFSAKSYNLSSQCSIRLDPTLLERVIINLLSNSIKYSPSGGKIRFDLSIHANCLTFQVCDQGIGIPIADQQQLFEQFYRASNVGRLPGTGLGLTIVKRCVEGLGGQVSVNSKVGIGTMFEVKIPIQK